MRTIKSRKLRELNYDGNTEKKLEKVEKVENVEKAEKAEKAEKV